MLSIKNKNLELVLLFIIPLIASVLVLFATRFHVGVSPDSTFYISAAQSIIETGEIRSIYEGSEWVYLSHYPPGYPIFLSGMNYFTMDFYESARYCNALAILILLFSVGLIARFHTQIIYALLLQAILLVNVEIFKLYEMAWTEPTYLIFSLIGLYTLYLFTKTKKLSWLIISGLIIAIAVAVRYVGITLIFSSVIYLWFAPSNETILKRIKHISIHGLLSSSLFVLWTIRNYILIDNPTNRHFSFHPMSVDYYLDWFKSTTSFFIPIAIESSIRWIIGVPIVVGLIAYTIYIFKKNIQSIKSIFLIYPWVYIALLFLSNTFLDDTPLYFRTLSPVYIFITISIAIHLFENTQKQVKLKTIIFSIFLIFYSIKLFNHISSIDDGRGYSSAKYMIPSTIRGINLIPENSKIYTNEVDRLYFLSKGKVSDWWKEKELTEIEPYYTVYFKNGRTISEELLDSTQKSLDTLVNTEDVLIRLHLTN